MRQTRFPALIALSVAIACAPIRRPAPTDAPINACPEHPCADYMAQGETDAPMDIDGGAGSGPACVASVCLVSPDAAPPPQHLILVVALPFDSPVTPPGATPGATYAKPYANLPFYPPGSGLQQEIDLPQPTAVTGVYYVDPSVAYNPHLPTFGELGFYVGSPPVVAWAALPAHVIYRPLWPPMGSAMNADGGPPASSEAAGLGLPLEPVQAGHYEMPTYRLLTQPQPAVGPLGAPVLLFAASLQFDLKYEQTITPDPPFDVAFPPHVTIDQFASIPIDEVQLLPDITTAEMVSPSFPYFAVSSARGVDGWTVYLRDATTKRPISTIRTLNDATADAGVLLPTSHVPPMVDALTNTELVMVPNADSGLPTYIVPNTFPQIAPLQHYPVVPDPVTIHGQIDWSDGQSAVADVTFEATGIYAAVAPPTQMDAGAAADATTGGLSDAGATYHLQPTGFEYTSTSTAELDAGVATYTIEVPRGSYRISIRPRDQDQNAAPPDASPAERHAVTVVSYDTGSDPAVLIPPSVTVDRAPLVSGTATVADGRPLVDATVEAIPTHCPNIADAGPPNDSPSCMPRYVMATTDGNGAFTLALDPGDYILRAEPLEGTRLPWVVQQIRIPTSEPVRFTIPAPVYRGLDVRDESHNAIANAIVRIFTMRGRGAAVEVGRAVTDRNGHFDMYLDPSVQ